MQPKDLRNLAEGYYKMYNPSTIEEETDYYDVILSYLLSERFAASVEDAEKIMSVMSEEWMESIVEDIPGFTPSAFPNMKQYPAVYKGQKGMVSGDEGAQGRGFRVDPKDYDKAVKQIEYNKKSPIDKVKSVLNTALGRNEEFEGDIFDIIKGHLLDEGYADSEESALSIMANMSEEWRDSIVEQSAIAQRAAAVVDDQRRGSYGLADDLEKTKNALKKLKPYPNGFPGVRGV